MPKGKGNRHTSEQIVAILRRVESCETVATVPTTCGAWASSSAPRSTALNFERDQCRTPVAEQIVSVRNAQAVLRRFGLPFH